MNGEFFSRIIFSSSTPVRIAATHLHVAAFLIRDDGAGHLWAGVCVVEDHEDLEAP